MPIQITEIQRKALIFIADEAKGREWAAPTAKELATHLYDVREPGPSDVASTQHVIDRLQNHYHCFIHKGPQKRRFIDSDTLVTDPGSAHYVLILRQLCRFHPNRCTTKEELHQKWAEDSHSLYSPELLEKMFKHAQRGKYIADEANTLLPDQIRQGQRIQELLPYLQELDSRHKL